MALNKRLEGRDNNVMEIPFWQRCRFLRLLLMYCQYIFTNLSSRYWRRRASKRMGEIGGERISAMEWSTENRAGLGVLSNK